MRLTEQIARLLTGTKKTVAVAESCTGGLLAKQLTDIPGSSAYFKAGLVTYTNAAKTKFLKVPVRTLRRHGAVSEQAAETMARQVRKLCSADFGLGITGIAGPSGGTRRKPVGLVYIAVSTNLEHLTVKCRFSGDRKKIRDQSVRMALKLLAEFLN